jgi:two-component system cell cycle response regulator
MQKHWKTFKELAAKGILSSRSVALALEKQQPEDLLRELCDCHALMEGSRADALAAQARLRAFFDAAPFGFFRLDAAGNILEPNSTSARMLGHDPAALAGCALLSFILPEFHEIFTLHRRAVFEQGEENSCNLKLKKTDGGEFHARLTSYPILDPGQPIACCRCFLSDITQLQQTVAELRKANQKMRDQQKALLEEERLKVLLQMAGATAHDLNQPLMTLLGNIELMRMNRDEPEKILLHLDRLEKAGQRIYKTVKKIQEIRYYEVKPYFNQTAIINLDQKTAILAVEQSDYEFEKISGILNYHSQIKLFRARSLAEATAMLGQRRFDLIFASSFLPDGNAIDLMRTVNENERNIPVVVFTGKDDDLLTAQMLQAGALEYIPKGRIGEKALTRIITNVMEKARLQREVRELEQKVLRLTRRDELTGLFNRRYLEETLDNEIARARRYRTDLVLCIMDLDRFRRVNQTHSRLAGDSVLVEVAGLLKRLSRQCDTVVRFGGEEFALLLPNTDMRMARVVNERFRQMVAAHIFEYRSAQISITVSAGIAAFNGSPDLSGADLVGLALQALKKAKGLGRNRVFEWQQWENKVPGP